MTQKYKLIANGVLLADRLTSIPNDPSNRDWQEYLSWLEEGNQPEPMDIPAEINPVVTIEERTEALELLVNYLLEGPTA